MIFVTIVTKSSEDIIRRSISFSSILFPKRLLKRNRPTGDRSYLSEDNSMFINSRALSAVAKSPSRKRLYISMNESERVLAVSFSIEVLITLINSSSSLSKAFMILSSVESPNTRRREATENLRFLSIRTYTAPSGSDSISIHTPRAGIIFEPK